MMNPAFGDWKRYRRGFLRASIMPNRGFPQTDAHAPERLIAQLIFLRDHIARRAGNEHALRTGIGFDVIAECARIICRYPQSAHSRTMSRQGMCRVVADQIKRKMRGHIIKHEKPKLLIRKTIRHGQHFPPIRGEGGTVVSGNVSPVPVFIALTGKEGNFAFPEIRQIPCAVQQFFFQFRQICPMQKSGL